MWSKALLIGLVVSGPLALADKTVQSTDSTQDVLSGTLPQWKQCLNQLCGDDLGKTGREITAHGATNGKELWGKYSEIRNAATMGAQTELKLQKKKLQVLVQMVRQNSKISDPRALELAGLTKILERLHNVEFEGGLVINENKSYDKLLSSGLSVQEINSTISITKQLVQKMTSRPSVMREPLELLKKKYNEKRLRKEIADAILKIDNAEVKVAAHFGASRSQAFPGVKSWEDLKRRLLADKWTALDLEQLQERYDQPILFLEMIKLNRNIDRTPILAKDLLNETQLKTAESKLADLNKALEPGATGPLSTTVTSIGHTCLGYAIAADLFFPTKEEFEKFAPTERKWRDEYVQRLSGRLSQETFGRLKPQILALRTVAGRTIENWREATLAKLATSKIEHEEEMATIESNEQDRILSSIFLAQELKSPSDEFSVAEDIQKICRDAGNFESDETDMLNGIVRIGALSVRNPNGGRGVEFHEFGHQTRDSLLKKGMLSDESRKKFESWQKCLSDAHGGSEKFLSEDFADLISMNFDDSRGGVFCRRMSGEDEGEFTVKDPEKDTHSSNLFRLLHSQSVRGQIPEICRTALAAKGESFQLQNCMK